MQGAYWNGKEWVYVSGLAWDQVFRAAEKANSRSVRHILEGGAVEKFIRLGKDWVAL